MEADDSPFPAKHNRSTSDDEGARNPAILTTPFTKNLHWTPPVESGDSANEPDCTKFKVEDIRIMTFPVKLLPPYLNDES